LLRQNLADAVGANKKLHEIEVIRETAVPPDNIITLSTDISETFTFKLTDLVYVAALDNYSEVYWKEEEVVSKKLLRVTLKNVETQLKNQFIVRCHRSYLINIREIESISGNTNGYKLRMKSADVSIPVSRTKGKEIIAHIQQIRDLMEMM
jgi:DNA-binding LytR/AlgR family response regulator